MFSFVNYNRKVFIYIKHSADINQCLILILYICLCNSKADIMKRLTPDIRCALIRAYFLTSDNYIVRRSFRDVSLNDVKYIASVFCSANSWTLLDISIVQH